MPRKLLIRNDWNPYHVTVRTNNREVFPLPLSEEWGIFCSEILVIQALYEVEVHAFVMMPNHVHLILTTPNPQFDLGKIMSVFLSAVTKETNKRTGKSGHLFGGPYHWTTIQSARYFYHALKYVYRNPVRGQLCSRVEHYPHSTFTGLVGAEPSSFPIHFTRAGLERFFPSLQPREWLEWLNRPFETELETKIQFGLRKKIFGPKFHKKTKTFDQTLDVDS